MKTETEELAPIVENLPAVAAPVPEADLPESSIVVFGNRDSFELAQRMAKLLSQSNLIPTQYQGNLSNCAIALEMSMRIKASPMAVMQNLYIIQGKPSWSSQFIIAALNACGKFSPIRFEVKGTGMEESCRAWAIEKATGERLEGPAASLAMAKAEGWLDKNGSKWKTMPEVMLRYRAAAFFGRLYAPDLLMGMQTQEEVMDVGQHEEKVIPHAQGVQGAKALLGAKNAL